MASIVKRGDGYRIHVSNGYSSDGKKIVETVTWTPDSSRTEKQNQKALNDFVIDFERKVKSGKYLDGNKMRFSDFAMLWKTEYAEKQLQITTLERNVYILEQIVNPELGHIVLSKLQPLHFQNLYSKLEKTGYTTRNGKHKQYSGSTFKRIHAVISGALNTALQWNLIDNNPALIAKPPKIEKQSKIKNFSIDETKTFLRLLEADTVPLQLKSFYNIALFAGARAGEIIALRWADINFESGSISITKSTCKTKSGQIDKPPKSKTSNRVINLPSSVMDILKKHKTEQQQLRLKLGSYWEGSDYLFIQTNGKQIYYDQHNISKR